MDSTGEIYLKHGKMIYGSLLTWTQDPGLVGELARETLCQAIENIGIYKGKNSVPAWLCGIARGLWYKHSRGQKRYMPLEEVAEIPVDSAEKQMLHSWDSIQILRLVHGLENPTREVIYLRLVESLTSGQIGEIMGKSESWARVAYYRRKGRITKGAEKL